MAPSDGDAGQFNWGHMSEAVILVVKWASQFFSMLHLQGLKCPRWLLHFHIWWPGWNGRRSLGSLVITLSTHGIFASSWAASEDGSLKIVRITWSLASPRSRIMVGAARLLGPRLRSSRMSLPLISISQASHSQVRFQGMGNTLHLYDERRSKESVVVFSPPQASYWLTLLGIRLLAKMPMGSPGLRLILSDAWQSSFSSGCHQRK